jgi:transcription elongation factor GreA
MKTMVTSAGLRKLEDDLIQLKGKEMRKAVEALAEAREKGDLSENAEYENARDHINMLNLKIQILDEKIRNTVVVHKEDVGTDSVQLFTNVKVLNKKTKKHMNFSIVTEDQIDVKSGKISQNSPIAQGLIGQSVGDVVKITIPAGVIEFKIIDITID